MLSKPKPSPCTRTVRPFETAYIEHVLIDLETADPFDGTNLGRLWLTIMSDENKWRVLAYYPTFQPPGFFSCMQVVNECAIRNGRLPRAIVTDDGLQFRSNHLEFLFAAYNITLILSPSAKAFVRSRWERLFRETETQLIAMLRRETQPLIVKRAPTAIYPKPADCDIMRFDSCLKDYMYAVRDVTHPSESGQDPTKPCDPTEELTPRLSLRALRDISFLSSTLPIAPNGITKIIPGKGVTVNHFKYWSPVFGNLSVGESQVVVRYDPFDLGIALAFVGDRWEECQSEFYSILQGRSVHELEIAVRKVRQQTRSSSSNEKTLEPQRIADYLSRVDEDEELLLQNRRDRACRQLRRQHRGNSFEVLSQLWRAYDRDNVEIL